MSPETVHILATVRRPELLPEAMLVFRTLRRGFPTATVQAWGNGLALEYEREMKPVLQRTNCEYKWTAEKPHDLWLEWLVLTEQHPFWVCDTDVVFFGSMEGYLENSRAAFAGRYEPAWHDDWSGTDRVERLHTCVMRINPAELRANMLRWCREQVPAVFHGGFIPFIRQTWLPGRGGNVLYDTMAGAWQAGWGTEFPAELDERFEHLNCGTYVDEVSKCPTYAGMAAAHREMIEAPGRTRGIQHSQRWFYAQHPVTNNREDKRLWLTI